MVTEESWLKACVESEKVHLPNFSPGFKKGQEWLNTSATLAQAREVASSFDPDEVSWLWQGKSSLQDWRVGFLFGAGQAFLETANLVLETRNRKLAAVNAKEAYRTGEIHGKAWAAGASQEAIDRLLGGHSSPTEVSELGPPPDNPCFTNWCRGFIDAVRSAKA